MKLCFASLILGAAGALAADTLAGTKIGNKTIERTVQLRTHSIYAPYIDQDLQNRWWDFGADAYINTNKHIRLTRPVQSQMGWLWSRLPVTAANFIVEVEFKISGESTHLYGDGMAIWFTTARAQPGPVFGSIDNFEGLMIAIDTYANARHGYGFPRIYAINGDGKTKYDHDNDGDSQTLGACSANIRRTNVATKLKITYLKDEYLDVKVQHKAWDEWTDCFHLNPFSLPHAPFIGFSALTGAITDAHDIISVTTSSAILSAADKQRDKLEGAGGSRFSAPSVGFGAFFKLLLFVGLCAGGFYGWKYYKSRQRYNPGGWTTGGRSSGNVGFGGMGYDAGGAFGSGAARGGFGDGFYSSSKRF